MSQFEFCQTIFYVQDVSATLDFYKRVFGFDTFFQDKDNRYGVLKTGHTMHDGKEVGMIGFSSADVVRDSMIKQDMHLAKKGQKPLGAEICLMTPDIETAYAEVIAKGAEAVSPPEPKPWGARVAYVRDLNGLLIELTTPMESDSQI